MTFRIEFVPLCIISEFIEYSSELRRDEDNEFSYASVLEKKGSLIFSRSNFYYKSEKCNGCSLFNRCCGLSTNYINVHGDNEVNPINEKKSCDGHYILKINNKCNANCIFCADSPIARKQDDPPFEDVIHKISLARKNFNSLIITGGEPTIYIQLCQTISYAKKSLKYEKIFLTTNGLRLADEKYLEKLIQSGVDEFLITFQTDDPVIYEKIMQVKNSFNYAVAGIENLKSKNLKIRINTVIHGLNYERLPNIVEFLISHKINSINFAFMNPNDMIQSNSKLFVSYSQVMPYLTKTIEIVKKLNYGSFNIENFPLCVAANYLDYLSDLKHPRDNKNYYSADKIKMDKCVNCRENNRCEGIWRRYFEIQGDDELIPYENNKILQ